MCFILMGVININKEVRITKSREDYENSYECRRDNLWKEIKEDSDNGYPKVISYFVKSGRTPVSGEVFTPPSPSFECEIDINKCFTAIKSKMMTKSGKLRASMDNLKDYEVLAWSELLNYIWTEYRAKENEKLLLSKREWFMLFGTNKK